MKIEITEQQRARFWDKVEIRSPEECWIWKASKIKGYGQFELKQAKTKSAHRVSFLITHGEIKDGFQVCHRCDNPPCVNPSHLFQGTVRENAMDAINKGRRHGPRGESCHLSKLTTADVLEIRRRVNAGEEQKSVAESFGLDPSTVSYIKHKKTWAWLCA